MKLKKALSCILAISLLISSLGFVVSAADKDTAPSGYSNQDYLETYASAAYGEKALGCTYSKASTTWKVWAPQASSVMVRLYTTGTDTESGAEILGSHSMSYNSKTGIWTLTLSGDYKNKYYTYIVDRNGVLSETQDPYATAVGANGNRSMVCDLDSTDPDGWDKDKHVLFDDPGDAVVWEVHVRDFSINVNSGVSEENRGKYLAFTEGDTTVEGKGKISSCVDYLVEHNVNCVQLMPIEDYASIDETDDRVHRNWGYDPKNFNVPEGSYSSDPYNGNTRITEFKMLVQALHDRGISVVMDVVYNHTYVLEGSALSMTTPKYYYRMSSSTDYHNGSGLGNVLSSEKLMTRKYISESLQYWVNEYHIDGFRFDLMGCFDIESMKVWRSDLDKINTRILMYGEPWTGGPSNGITNGITNGNLKQLTRVGAFNEGYSDGLKGDHEIDEDGGFLFGGSNTEMLNAAKGSSSYLSGCKPNQCINYTDNHDNLILFDKILAANKTSGFTVGKDDMDLLLYEQNKKAVNNPSSKVLSLMRLALTSALTSQGIPFTVAGTEFCRTKYGDSNSYRTPDESNAIDWSRAATYSSVADYYAGLAAIRKAFSAFGSSTAVSITTLSGGCTAYRINNSKSGEWASIIVAMNPASSAKSVTLPSGSWNVIADGAKAGTTKISSASGSYSVPAYSGVILVDASSFSNYTQPKTGTATLTVEHYTRDSSTGEYKKVRTETSKFKEGQTYRASKNLPILFDHNFDKFESTTNATYGAAKADEKITVKFYYTRYIKSGYLIVNFLSSADKSDVKTRMRYHLRDGDTFSIPATLVQGYQLDTSKYPGGTIGVFDADDPASFDFYYIALKNTTTIVHFYNSANWARVLCYAYDDQGNEPLGPWTAPSAMVAMTKDTEMGANWYTKEIPSASCYVMFHYGDYQIPGQGETGFVVSGEAWIKDGIVSFNNTIVTSHIELSTGKQLNPDITKHYTSVSSNRIYTTSPLKSLGREYITPANATGFYQAGVTNAVYLYKEKIEVPTTPTDPTQGGGSGSGNIFGDTDLSGSVEITDATWLQRHLAKIITLSADALAISDVDNDGQVSVVDATFIQSYLAKIKRDNSRVGQKDGSGGSVNPTEPSPGPTENETTATEPVTEPDEYTYEEFVDLYNDLTTKLATFNAKKYSSNEYYIAALDAINRYRSVSLNPAASASELETACKACDAALKGLDNIVVDVNPTGYVYLSPDIWNKDGARFAAYFYDESEAYEWVSMKLNSDSVYEAAIPDDFTNVIFVRLGGTDITNSWDNAWNQSANLSIMEDQTYYITGWGAEGVSEGNWG